MSNYLIALLTLQFISQTPLFYFIDKRWHVLIRIIIFIILLFLAFGVVPGFLSREYTQKLSPGSIRCGVPLMATIMKFNILFITFSAIIQLALIETTRIYIMKLKDQK